MECETIDRALPIGAVMLNWCGPTNVPAGTLATMVVLFHVVVGKTVVPSSVT
ncbi:MAG: hypothetical protein R2867_39745 [Caldilineaceae bacterium]